MGYWRIKKQPHVAGAWLARMPIARIWAQGISRFPAGASPPSLDRVLSVADHIALRAAGGVASAVRLSIRC